jgi:uncharacterized cupredoxin-like copper-binding protein
MAAVLGACGDDGSAPGAGGHAHDHTHGDTGHAAAPSALAFGEPGDPAAADRTVEVAAGDPYRFDPESLELNAGEIVTFVVSNEGQQLHEFVLGDRDYQDAHETEMASGAMHHEGNAVTVAPGDTEELTWKFSAEGEVLYGCHVTGHYEGGMVGTIQVSA